MRHSLIELAESQMVRISFVIIFGVLEVRSRTIHSEGKVQDSMKRSIIRHFEDTPRNVKAEFKSKYNTLKLLEHVINQPLMMNLRARSEKLHPQFSSSLLKSEAKKNQIISHTVNKRSPGCLLWCLNKKILHPAQCHSYCTFSG